MNEEIKGTDREMDSARFSDRVVAFSIDVALFYVGYAASVMYALSMTPPLGSPGVWIALWVALFLIYQAFCSCEGRASIGKKLLGLRVVGPDGEPLSLGQSVLRTSAYPVSSVMGLGFLWSLFSATRQCWHDMVVGSAVVVVKERAVGGRMLVRAGAMACLAVVAGAWMWNNVWASRYYRIMDLAYARMGLTEVVQLEKIYHQNHGRYAVSLVSLASVSGDPEGFLRDMAILFDLNAGFQIETTAKGFTIHAKAKDSGRTPMTLQGP